MITKEREREKEREGVDSLGRLFINYGGGGGPPCERGRQGPDLES